MKIADVRIYRLNAPPREQKTKPRRPPWRADAEVAKWLRNIGVI